MGARKRVRVRTCVCVSMRPPKVAAGMARNAYERSHLEAGDVVRRSRVLLELVSTEVNLLALLCNPLVGRAGWRAGGGRSGWWGGVS